MKAIIPVAGAGTKLRPHTYTQPKALIPLAGKTILSINVDQLHDAGINEFIFIVGYLGEKIQDYIKEHYPTLVCHYIFQNERKGTAHAVDLAKKFIDGDEVFIALGDTICEYDVAKVLACEWSVLGVKKVDDPRNFGVAEMDEDYMISRVVEKPSIPKSNMALIGIYKIKEAEILFACLEKVESSKVRSFDEYSLTDAIECMITKGVKFKAFKVGNWFDCGKRETLLESNAILLKKFGGTIPDPEKYKNSIFIQPVSIGNGCVIVNSVIGPNVAVGDHSIINHSILKDSIIGAYSNLHEIVLKDSLIGSDAEVKGVSRNLNIGDNTAIDLSGGSYK